MLHDKITRKIFNILTIFKKKLSQAKNTWDVTFVTSRSYGKSITDLKWLEPIEHDVKLQPEHDAANSQAGVVKGLANYWIRILFTP